MKQKILTTVSLAVVCFMMVACVAYDGNIPVPEMTTAEPAVTANDPAETDIPVQETEFRIEPIEDMTNIPLALLHAEWAEIPVYAVMAEDGTLMLYTSAHEERSGNHGLLNVYIEPAESDPVVAIDNKTGFVELPELAKIDSYESAGFVNVVVESAESRDPLSSYAQGYYVIRDESGEQIGIVPVNGVIEKTDGTGYEAVVQVADTVCMYIDVDADEHSAAASDPTETPIVTKTPVVTEEPAATEAPVVTASPTATAKQAATPKPTAKPAATPKPTDTPTPEPTAPAATPTPFVWYCIYCGKTFGSSDDDYERWYQHAWYNPGCYSYGYAVTPVPETPTPRPGGHYEDVWVVDVPRKTHDVWHCNVCGYESTVWYGDFDKHQTDHSHAGEGSGYHSYTVVDQEEQGHWEKVWVPDP